MKYTASLTAWNKKISEWYVKQVRRTKKTYKTSNFKFQIITSTHQVKQEMSKSSHDLRVINLSNKISSITRNSILSEIHKSIYFKDSISASDSWNSW